MRATLEQLKAMSDEQLAAAWNYGQFPFENASCGRCLTQHKYYPNPCEEEAHVNLRAAVAHLATFSGSFEFAQKMRPHLEELYALRLFYDSLYPQTAEAEQLPQTETVAVRV